MHHISKKDYCDDHKLSCLLHFMTDPLQKREMLVALVSVIITFYFTFLRFFCSSSLPVLKKKKDLFIYLKHTYICISGTLNPLMRSHANGKHVAAAD